MKKRRQRTFLDCRPIFERPLLGEEVPQLYPLVLLIKIVVRRICVWSNSGMILTGDMREVPGSIPGMGL